MDDLRVIIKGVDGFKNHQPLPVDIKSRLIPKGTHQNISVTTAVALVPPVDEVLFIQSKAYITVEGADVRYRLDSTNPTSTIGHLVKLGGEIVLDSIEEIIGFRVINITTTATLQISYKTVVAS